MTFTAGAKVTLPVAELEFSSLEGYAGLGSNYSFLQLLFRSVAHRHQY